MKLVLRTLILAISFAGWGWSEVRTGERTSSNKFLSAHAIPWRNDLCWQADPIPSLLQVYTQALEERPVSLEKSDESLHEPSGFTILYITGFYQFDDWDLDIAAWFQTEKFPDFFPIIDWPEQKHMGAYWIRPRKWGPWMLPSYFSNSAKKSKPFPSWLYSLSVPFDLRTSMIDRLPFNQPSRSPFTVPLTLE